jgi:hypothetical protein
MHPHDPSNLDAARSLLASLRAMDAMLGKAVGTTGRVPSADAILARALIATGYSAGWEAGLLDDDQRREVLRVVVVEGQERLRFWAEALVAEFGADETKALFGAVLAKVGTFFDRAGQFIRELFTAGVLAVAGPDPISHAQQEALDRNVDIQLEYLEDFRRRVVSEQRPLGPAFVANAAQYGAATWGNVLEVHRQGIIAVGAKTEEQRVLGQVERHCEVCPGLADGRWHKIGTLPAIGDTPCRVNCDCHFTYR